MKHRYISDEHLRGYLREGGAPEHVDEEAFLFDAEAFERAVEEVTRQHPYLSPAAAEARAAYRLLTKDRPPKQEASAAGPAIASANDASLGRYLRRWKWAVILWAVAVLVLLGVIAAKAEPEPHNTAAANLLERVRVLADVPGGLIVQLQNQGSVLATRPAGLLVFNCSTNMSCSFGGTTFTITSSSTASTAWSAITAGTNSNAGTFAVSGNTWDFSAASSFTAKTGAGYGPTVNGQFGYDTTANKWVFGQNAATVSFGQPGTCTNQVVTTLSATAAPTCTTITSAYTSGTFSPNAHNLLSASHGDTTAASAVRGDGLFAIGASSTWQRLAHPTASGGYFKWNGTDIVASSGAAAGTGSCAASQFQTADNADAAPTCAQPGFADISGTASSAQVPHAVLSAFHTDTAAGTVARGDVITGQSVSPTWQRLALGANGQCLTSNGTDALWGSCGAGGGAPGGTTGQTQVNGGGTFAGKIVYYASAFSGADNCIKTVAAISAASAAGGAWVYMDFNGPFTCTGGLTVTPGVYVWAGPFQATVGGTVTVQQSAKLLGFGANPNNNLGTEFIAKNFLNAPVVSMDAGGGNFTHWAEMGSFRVEGNSANQSNATIVAGTGASRSTNVVTITTTAAHNFLAGQEVTIAGVTDSSFNGVFTVTAPVTGTTFTYAQTGANATSGSGTAKATGASGIETHKLGENSFVHDIVTNDTFGAGMRVIGNHGSTHHYQAIAVFGAKNNCGWFLDGVTAEIHLNDIGDDGTPCFMKIAPGVGSVAVTATDVKMDSPGATDNANSFVIDGTLGGVELLCIRCDLNAGAAQTDAIKLIAGTAPNVTLIQARASGYTNLYNSNGLDIVPITVAGGNSSSASFPFFQRATGNSSGLVGTTFAAPVQFVHHDRQVNNGTNQNIPFGNTNGADSYGSFMRVTTATASFGFGGFSGGQDGFYGIVYNSTSQSMYFTNEDTGSTAANRIKTGTGGTVTLPAGPNLALFIYSGPESRWILLGTQPSYLPSTPTTWTAVQTFNANVDMTSNAILTEIANDTTTGTTVNQLAKLSGAPSKAIITATTDTGGSLGVVAAGAGTSGNVQIAQVGQVSCVFDGATTAGDYVQISSTTAGDCKDAGSTYPTSGQVLGRVLSTNGAGGTYNMILFGPEIKAAAGGGGGASTADSFVVMSTNSDLTNQFYLTKFGHGNWLREEFAHQAYLNNGAYEGAAGTYLLQNINGTGALTAAQSAQNTAGLWRIASGATSGNDSLFSHDTSGSTDIFPAASATLYTYETRFKLTGVANNTFTVGLGDVRGAGGNPIGSLGIYCNVTDTASAGNWACHTRDGAGGNVTDITLSPAQTADTNFHSLRITVSSSTVTFFWDDTQVGSSTTHITTNAIGLGPFWESKTNTSAATSMDVDGWSFWQGY